MCIRYFGLIAILAFFTPVSLRAQSEKQLFLLDNWYVQMGMDMTLQNPYGHDFSEVFPNGKSFGVDVALGRWFTPEMGLRLNVNWENGISLLENGHANWLAPFDQLGVNLDKGGYWVMAGDVQFDVHNLLFGYDPARTWNLQIYPRAGLVYNCGVDKSSPLLGLGIGNTFRLSDSWSLCLDVVYNVVSSGFTGVEKETGAGSNSNGFMNLNVGVQRNLGTPNYRYGTHLVREKRQDDAAWKNGLWDNWFLQAGVDMSLQNPYRCNFAQTFPKGKSFGVDLAVGKWFSPEIGLRGCLNWENGLPFLENHHLEWVAKAKGSESNMADGGYLLYYIDVLVDLNNFLVGYDPSRKGSILLFPRAGLSNNLSIGSGSPLVGMGLGYNYRLTDALSLFVDAAYQATTSEFYSGVGFTGMDVSMCSNGFMDVLLGVQWNLK